MIAFKIICAAVALLAVCWGARRVFNIKPHFDPDMCAANSFGSATVGTHQDSLCKKVDAALAECIIVKTGTDENHVAACGTTDIPLGVTGPNDAPTAAEQLVTIHLFGGSRTLRLTASEAIADGALVYLGASGKAAASGTQCIGWAVTNAAADGDIFECATCTPQPAPGISASAFDANSILYATTDDTPVALTVGANTVVGRGPSGNISARTLLTGTTATPVAAAGSTVADAGQLTGTLITNITSDGATKGVKLPTGVAGMMQIVINGSATACELYAASGGTVNGLSADASIVVPASKGVLCLCNAADTWVVYDLPAKATAS